MKESLTLQNVTHHPYVRGFEFWPNLGQKGLNLIGKSSDVIKKRGH